MIKVRREELRTVKDSVRAAIMTATNLDGFHILVPTPSDQMLDKAVMMAVQSLTMDLFGPNDVATPHDIAHISFSKTG